MSESAVRDKPFLFYGLARNRRSPKRPPEPLLSGVPLGRGRSGKRWRSLPLENDGWLLGIGSLNTEGTHGNSQRSARSIFRLTDSQSA